MQLRTARAAAAAAVAFSLAAPAFALDQATVRAGDRAPAALILLGPRAGEPTRRGSILLDVAARALDRHTDLRALSPEQAGYELDAFAQCRDRERLACWVREARRGGEAEAGASYLLVLSVRPVGGADELSLILLDTQAALDAEARARAAGADSSLDAIENEIYRAAVKTRELSVEARDDAEYAQRFEEGFTAALRAMLEPIGRWELFATVELAGCEPGISLGLDGRALGETTAAHTVIEEVRPGRHELSLTRRGERAPAYRASIEVARGGRTRLTAELLPPVIEPSTANRAVLYGGLSAAAAGTILVAGALILAPRTDALAVCPNGQCSTREHHLSNFCELTASDPRSCGSGGLLAAPLGFALVSAGATWSLGAMLEEEREVPWLSILAGVTLGAAVYGTGAALR